MQLRLGQQLTMTPQLQQAIRLLQMSMLDLRDEIQVALESNLMLENAEEAERLNGEEGVTALEERRARASLDAAAEREVRPESTSMPDELPVDSDWGDHYESYLPSGGPGSDAAEFDFLAQQSRRPSLQDHLQWQLDLSRLDGTDVAIATVIVDAINADGYLTADVAELIEVLDDADLTPKQVLAVLHWIQSLDPPGVGARDLCECLLIQLRQLPARMPRRDLAIAICQQAFDTLSKNDPEQIGRRLGVAPGEVAEAIALIRTLHPRPGARIGGEETRYVIPDVFVRKREGAWSVELNSETTPRLRVNTDYAKLIRRADQSQDNLLLKNHLQEARWFIKSLASRNDTVLSVASKIVELQRDFLEYGEEAMKPLILRDVAEALDLHESTVSRVTRQKYMYTPRGTFEFKFFFSSHVATTTGGECSSTAIRAFIRKLVAAEKPDQPLSDNSIALILVDQGIDVARRTVAKYREALNIPPSHERRRGV